MHIRCNDVRHRRMPRTTTVLHLCILAGVVLVMANCRTAGRGIYTVPVSRDYSQLERTDIDEARRLCDEAHRVGTQRYAPFEYFSATHYLEAAERFREEADLYGQWDYAGLAKYYAQEAIAKGAVNPKDDPMGMRLTTRGARAAFDQVKAEYDAIDKTRAKATAPVVYAHLTAALSLAEHEMNRPLHAMDAIRALRYAEADIEIIKSFDTDKDGVPDLYDDDPYQPEDFDGFEDGDGAPDIDNDEDGIPDSIDLAPDEPETRNRFQDYDGAPDEYPQLDAVMFESGSALLTDEMRGYLRGITCMLVQWPNLELHLTGYTDDLPSEMDNLTLAQQRVTAVKEYVARQGVPEEKIVATFHGEKEAAPETESVDEMSLNRRVDMTLK